MDENRVSVPADPGGAMLFVFSMEVISFGPFIWMFFRREHT